MICGIEETTDMNHPETKVVWFTSKVKALQWKQSKSGDYAWSGAADGNLPPTQQNWHRRFRRLYELPKGFRKPTLKEFSKRPYYHGDCTTFAGFTAKKVGLTGFELR